MQQGRCKPLETRGHTDFRQLNVFEKQRVLGLKDPLEWSPHLKTRKFFTQLRRHHCFTALGDDFLFSTFMRACFDFLGQKTGLKPRGHGPPSPSPYYSPGCNISRITSLRDSTQVDHLFFFFNSQGAKKVIFKASHSGKLKLAYTSPNIISTSLKNTFMRPRIYFTVLL